MKFAGSGRARALEYGLGSGSGLAFMSMSPSGLAKFSLQPVGLMYFHQIFAFEPIRAFKKARGRAGTGLLFTGSGRARALSSKFG